MYPVESCPCADTFIKNAECFQQLSDGQLIWQHQMVKLSLWWWGRNILGNLFTCEKLGLSFSLSVCASWTDLGCLKVHVFADGAKTPETCWSLSSTTAHSCKMACYYVSECCIYTLYSEFNTFLFANVHMNTLLSMFSHVDTDTWLENVCFPCQFPLVI